MNTYSIGPDDKGGFHVTAIGPSGEGGYITFGFATEAAARSWANNRREIEASAARMPLADRPV